MDCTLDPDSNYYHRDTRAGAAEQPTGRTHVLHLALSQDPGIHGDLSRLRRGNDRVHAAFDLPFCAAVAGDQTKQEDHPAVAGRAG